MDLAHPDADNAAASEPEGPERAAQGQKRKAPMSREEWLKKVKKTIGWFNKHGGLQNQIHYRTVSQSIEALNPREALKILNELEAKAPKIHNPTAWVKKAAENLGPELDKKVRNTIAWYNRNGELPEPIKYDEVRELLGYLSAADSCRLLGALDGKGAQIQKPTAYLCKAARNKLERDGPSAGASGPAAWAVPAWTGGRSGKGGGGYMGKGWGRGKGAPVMAFGAAVPTAAPALDTKVRRTIGWYNKNGGLQGEIYYDEVAPMLALVGTSEALKILDGLDPAKGRNTQIKNPTAWIKKAVQNILG